MCGVSSTLLSYLRRISNERVAYLAYQWRMCYVCAKYVSLLWSMCDVLGVLGIFYGIPREYQMFLTGRGGVQGSFRATLGVASVFIHDILRSGWGAWRCPPPSAPPPLVFLFGVNLDYLDFSSGIFDLQRIIDNCNVRIA